MSEGAKIIEDKGWFGSRVECAIAKVLSKKREHSTNFDGICHSGRTGQLRVGGARDPLLRYLRQSEGNARCHQ